MEFLGVETEEALDSFMSPSLADFNDPHLMKDMDKAVKYLKKAIDSNNRICLFGDYDADGVTSTALFVRVLRELKHNNFFYFIPDRQKDGYGISEENIQKVLKKQISLSQLITEFVKSIHFTIYPFQSSLLTTTIPLSVVKRLKNYTRTGESLKKVNN